MHIYISYLLTEKQFEIITLIVYLIYMHACSLVSSTRLLTLLLKLYSSTTNFFTKFATGFTTQ